MVYVEDKSSNLICKLNDDVSNYNPGEHIKIKLKKEEVADKEKVYTIIRIEHGVRWDYFSGSYESTHTLIVRKMSHNALT